MQQFFCATFKISSYFFPSSPDCSLGSLQCSHCLGVSMASAKQWYCLVSAVSGSAARAAPRHVQLSRTAICVCIRRGWDAAPSHSLWFLHLFSWVGFAQRAPSTCSCPWEHWGRGEESWVKPCKCCGQKFNIPGITTGEKDVGKIRQISSEVFSCSEARCPLKVLSV